MAVPTRKLPSSQHTLYVVPKTQRKKKDPLAKLMGAGLLFLLMVGGSFLLVMIVFLTAFLGANTETQPVGEWKPSFAFPPEAIKYLPIYQAAGKKYGVPWPILAAIHKVETDFGRNVSVSSAGAVGQTQFMDKTWLGWSYPGGSRLGDLPASVDITNPALIKKYGGYGVDGDGDGKADPYDPVDALYSTANYLAANHHPNQDWFARGGPIWQYNHDYEHYVLLVKKYATLYATPIALQQGSAVATGHFTWPVPQGRLTSPFGWRVQPITQIYQEHDGIDIGKALGAPILASDGGVVVESRAATGYGWIIVIDHENGYQTLYAHMNPQDVKVVVGEIVKQGQLIALMGSNGSSTGPHLHFEIHQNGEPIDPELLLSKQ